MTQAQIETSILATYQGAERLNHAGHIYALGRCPKCAELIQLAPAVYGLTWFGRCYECAPTPQQMRPIWTGRLGETCDALRAELEASRAYV